VLPAAARCGDAFGEPDLAEGLECGGQRATAGAELVGDLAGGDGVLLGRRSFLLCLGPLRNPVLVTYRARTAVSQFLALEALVVGA
jgi:hypothetical protein